MQVSYMAHHGDDLLVVNAARVSFDKASMYSYMTSLRMVYIDDEAMRWAKAGWEAYDIVDEFVMFRKLADDDVKLLQYLARGMPRAEWHNRILDITNADTMDKREELIQDFINVNKHWGPFAHPHITLRVSAPVPVRTQAFKTKVGMVESEESRRYITSTPVLFIPDHFRKQAENKKQGSGEEHPHSPYWLDLYSKVSTEAIKHYVAMVADGVCAEQARFILPQGCEVKWVWTGSLAAYARFYNLRTDSHAQQETGKLASLIGGIIAPLYPHSWAALTSSEAMLYDKTTHTEA